MDRRSAFVLLAVFGVGVFLAGLELLITAVALPSILADLVAANGTSAWAELRKASWIINGYLLVYILVMPLAGRLSDLWGIRRLFLGALAIFVVGSLAAGLAQSLDQLIAARLFQAVGGGALVPVGTAAAAHLYGGGTRARALGVIGALTFLGMAAGPFLGAAILAGFHPETVLAGSPLEPYLAPAWRWVFFVNIPIGIAAAVVGWAAAADWDTPRRAGRVDLPGAALYGIALAAGLVALTLLGATTIPGSGIDPVTLTVVLTVIAVVATVLAVTRALRTADPFIDVRLFRRVPFSSAAIVSALTGYAFATAIIGAAVFVDRVLYGGPDEQRLALGALAGATAVGALVSAGWSAGSGRGSSRSVGIGLRRRRAAVDGDVDRGDADRHRRGGAGDLRPRLRPDGDAALERGHRVGGAGGLRPGVVDRDRRADARHGGRPRHPDRLRVDDDRSPVGAGLRHARGVPGSSRPSCATGRARSAGGRSARGLGVARGGVDHGRPVPRGGGRDDRGDPAVARPGRPVGAATDPTARGRGYAHARWHRRRPRPLSDPPDAWASRHRDASTRRPTAPVGSSSRACRMAPSESSRATP